MFQAIFQCRNVSRLPCIVNKTKRHSYTYLHLNAHCGKMHEFPGTNKGTRRQHAKYCEVLKGKKERCFLVKSELGAALFVRRGLSVQISAVESGARLLSLGEQRQSSHKWSHPVWSDVWPALTKHVAPLTNHKFS